MKFSDRYTIKIEEGKLSVSHDAFAVGEMLQMLIDKIEKVRLDLNG